MSKPKIKIDVISDVVCPWCYIGKRRLEKAVSGLAERFDFDIHYHPFQLNPDVPAEGFDQKAYLIRKFGGEARYRQVTVHVKQVAAGEGLNFDFEKQRRSPNTFDSHRIIWLAGRENRQKQTVETLFRAYFEEGTDLTSTETLIELAARSGLDKNQVKAVLESNLGKEEVRSEEGFYKSLGITGVPFYIINDKYALSGAQPAEVFEEALQDIASKGAVEGESCDAGGNC